MAETIRTLQRRRAWLMEQVEETDRALEKLGAKARKPVQPELPAIPPKPPPEPSKEILAYRLFCARRERHFRDLQVDLVPEAKPISAAWITVTFQSMYRAVNDEDERIFELIDLFFEQDWPAKFDVPYCFAAFASEKVWRKQLLPKLLEQRADARAAAH